MKRPAILILLWACVLIVFLPASAFADVGSTADGAAGPAALYVAGNPNGFPVEGYDAGSDTYVGAAPAFLQLVSERTDLDFVYIRAGNQDHRETLARNNQVDLLFATSEESALLDLGEEAIRLFSVAVNGVPTDVYCVFTAVSAAEDRSQVRAVAESLTKDEISLLITADSTHFAAERGYNRALILLGVAFVVALAAVAVLALLLFKKKRKSTAFVDTATRIGNKQYFIRTFRTMISDPARELYYVIHFAFDIDWINNTYGVEESDEILRYAADTITQRMKDNEFCARIGGGAFAAAIYSSGKDQVENRVDEILRVLNAYSGKYKNGELKSLFRAGVCALAIDDKNPDKVLYNAEQAYRRALEDKSAFVFVNHDVLNQQQARVSIREQAGEALKQHAFTPYVQFIISAEDGSICGGEMLSRWPNRLYGLLNPGTYVPILQDTGLIVDHDLLMLEEACKMLQEWASKGKNWFLTCNLTRITLSDPTLVERITSIAQSYSFPKEKMILEVTEDSLEEDKDSATQNITALKKMGFRIALDDFSSGFTSFSDLYGYAVDLVKLDRQIIMDAERDPQAAALMTEITRLCHEMHIRVLAEGVETEAQVRQVQTARCNYIQGYYYARPLPLRELEGFVERYRPATIERIARQPAEDSSGEQSPQAAVCVVNDEPEQTDAARQPAEGGSGAQSPQAAVCVANEKPEQADTAQQSAGVYFAERSQKDAVCVLREDPEPAGIAEKYPPESVRESEAPQGMIQGESAPINNQFEKGESAVNQEEMHAMEQTAIPAAKQALLQIQFGPYHLELPGSIDMDSVVGILRAIQAEMIEAGRVREQ